MFKSLFDDLIEFVGEEPLNTPSFIKHIPLDLVIALRSLYLMGTDVDNYMRFIHNTEYDRIFIIYKGLLKDINHVIVDDIIIYKGKFTHITILDYAAIFHPEMVERFKGNTLINLLYAVVSSSILFLQTQNQSMFFKKDGVVRTVFDEALCILFIQLIRTIYGDSDPKVRKYTMDILNNHYKKSHGLEDMTDKVYDIYCSLGDNNPIEFLLDCSVIGGVRNPDIGKEDEETMARTLPEEGTENETVQ